MSDKVREFNPRYAEAEGVLLGTFRHLHTDIYGNRGEIIGQEVYVAICCDKIQINSLSRH